MMGARPGARALAALLLLFCVQASADRSPSRSLMHVHGVPQQVADRFNAAIAEANKAVNARTPSKAYDLHAALRRELIRDASLPWEAQHHLLMLQAYNLGNHFLAAVHDGAAQGDLHFDTRPAQIEAARSACREFQLAAAYFPAKAAAFPRLHFNHGIALQQLQWATSRHRGAAARRRGDTHVPEAVAALRRALAAATRRGVHEDNGQSFFVDEGEIRKHLANVLAFDARRCEEAAVVLARHPALVAGDRMPVWEELAFIGNCIHQRMHFSSTPASDGAAVLPLHGRALRAVTVLARKHFYRDAHRLTGAVLAAGGGERQATPHDIALQKLKPLLALARRSQDNARQHEAGIDAWRKRSLATTVAAASHANALANADPAAPRGKAAIMAAVMTQLYQEAAIAMARSLERIGVPGFVLLVIGDDDVDAEALAARMRNKGVRFALAPPHGYGGKEGAEGMRELSPACVGWRRVHHFKAKFMADVLNACRTDLVFVDLDWRFKHNPLPMFRRTSVKHNTAFAVGTRDHFMLNFGLFFARAATTTPGLAAAVMQRTANVIDAPTWDQAAWNLQLAVAELETEALRLSDEPIPPCACAMVSGEDAFAFFSDARRPLEQDERQFVVPELRDQKKTLRCGATEAWGVTTIEEHLTPDCKC